MRIVRIAVCNGRGSRKLLPQHSLECRWGWFTKGEQLSLIELAEDADATVSARNRNHEVLFQAYVRNGFVEGMDMKIAEMDDWDLTLQ